MTNQEAFDKIWQWFVVDKHPQSRDDAGHCCYRGPNGLKCAAGVLIPDDKYQPSFEGQVLASIIGLTDLWDCRFVVYDIQRVHDSWMGKPSWPVYIERELRRVATSWHLTIPGE